MTGDQREIRRKLRVLEHGRASGDVSKTCRCFGIGRAGFHRWRAKQRSEGEAGPTNNGSAPHDRPGKTPAAAAAKVPHLRRRRRLGSMRIVRRPERRHGIRISDAGVRRMLRRNGLDRLPRGARLRKVRAGRCNRQVPGRRLRMDVKFLTFKGKDGRKTRRFPFAAIDDATRGRALKIRDRRARANAVPFVDRAIETFPFRIREIRADDGHEFQAKFRRRVEDQGVRHARVKPRSPQLDGKVERSHGSDEQEFHRRLNCKGDVDLEAKLEERERFHNLARPHGAHGGKPPYEALREKL